MSLQVRQFALQLSNRYTVLLLLLLIGVPVVVGCVQAGEWLVVLLGISKLGRMGLEMALFLAGLITVFLIVKHLSRVPTVVTVGTDRLIILNQKTNQQRELLFTNIMAYRAVDFNGMADLRLKLTDSSKLTLHANSYLHSEQDFDDMMRTFEQAVSRHQTRKTACTPVVIREKTVFEKPLATFLLVPFIAVLVWLTWDQHAHHRHTSSSLFSLWGIFSAYLVAWVAGRERRNGKEE